MRQAELNVDKIENNIENVKQVIDLQQTVSKEIFKNSLANLDAQQRNMVLAESVYNTTKRSSKQV